MLLQPLLIPLLLVPYSCIRTTIDKSPSLDHVRVCLYSRLIDHLLLPPPGVARNDVAYCPLNYPAENSTKFV